MTRSICLATLLIAGPILAVADQYWIAYEGDDYPENEGWWRLWYHQPAERRLEEGALVIDSRADISIADFYERWLYGNLDPEPGEVFVMQWRLRIDEVIGRVDPSIGVFSDEKWAVGFEFDEDSITSVFETDMSASFEPGVYHSFELRSLDMLRYELYIDEQLALEGSFWLSLTPSLVGWGDGVQGGASLTHWDYFRFGVVPEPTSGIPLALGLLAGRHRS